VAFSPDGKTLVSGGAGDGDIRLWDVATGRHKLSFIHRHTAFLGSGRKTLATAALFSPDGKMIISSCPGDRLIRLWDAASGEARRTFAGGGASSTAVALSPDGKTLAAGSEDGVVWLWDVATGRELFPDGGHHGRVFFTAFAAGGAIVSAADDGAVRVWDATGGQSVRDVGDPEDPPSCVAVSPDGKLLATARVNDEAVTLWDLATGTEVRSLWSDGAGFSEITFSPDGKLLAGSLWLQPIGLWDVAAGKRLWKVSRGPRFEVSLDALFTDDSLSFSADGRVLARIGDIDVVVLSDTASGKPLREMQVGEKQRLHRVLCAPDGRTLATAAADNTVCLWAISSGRLLHKLDNLALVDSRGEKVRDCLAYSPDSRLLAFLGQEGRIHLWEVATRKEVRQFRGHRGAVASLAFAADGEVLASGGWDTSVLLWDVTGLSPQGRLAGRDLSPTDLRTLWDDLGGADAPRAHRALWALAAAPRQAVPWMAARLRPAAEASSDRLNRLIADLDSDQFAVREKAAEELLDRAQAAEPLLRKALAGDLAPEAERRIEGVLAAQADMALSREGLRSLRAVAALEQMGTPEARLLLERLAGGDPTIRTTQEARAALVRLGKRRGAPR
jgi:WD40 repeat protein